MESVRRIRGVVAAERVGDVEGGVSVVHNVRVTTTITKKKNLNRLNITGVYAHTR